MPGPRTVEPEALAVGVGAIGALYCSTGASGRRRYHLTLTLLHADRGRAASRPVLEGYVKVLANGTKLDAMGLARVVEVEETGLATVERLPEQFWYSWLDSRAHGRLVERRIAFDLDHRPQLIAGRGEPLDALDAVDPTCHKCVRWSRSTRRALERAEGLGRYRLRLSRPCTQHGRRDVCELYFKEKTRVIRTAGARARLGVGPGGVRLPDDWDGPHASGESTGRREMMEDGA